MGRTVASFTHALNRERRNLQNYRKALRKEDREVFDELWEMARSHIQACSYSAFPLPMEGILLSMCMELLKKIKELEAEEKK